MDESDTRAPGILHWLPKPGSPPSLWGPAAAGMSVAEVGACIPQGIAPSQPERLAHGVTEELRLVDVRLGAQPFSVGFFFLHGRLQQVTATLTNVRSFLDVMLTFSSLQAALRSACGPEQVCSIEEDEAEAAWECGGTEIRLLALSFDRHNGILNLITRPTEDAARAEAETASDGVGGQLKAAEAVESAGLALPALDLYEMLEAQCRRGGNTALMARCLFGKARVLRVLGRVAEAKSEARMALALARSVPDNLPATIERFMRELPDIE